MPPMQHTRSVNEMIPRVSATSIALRSCASRWLENERTWIVSPEDVSVLDSVDARAITLVTCYPFYFVGSAPQRFIVRAVEQNVN